MNAIPCGSRVLYDGVYTAKVARWHKSYGDRAKLPEGYHAVKFSNGLTVIMVHRSRLTLI